MAPRDYNPDRDVPDLSGKVIFVTGGTAGLGREDILALSKHNPHIFFTGRDVERANSLIAEVGSGKATFIECDHASLSSIRDAAEKFLSLAQRLDVLICNAGVMTVPPGLSKDGYEIHFAINHLSHALLIKFLLPLLKETSSKHSEARIVTIGSLAASTTAPEGIAFDGLRTTLDDWGFGSKWRRYGHAKLANIIYAWELARQYPWLTVVSLEPGTVWTGLFSHLGFVDKMFAAIFIWWRCIPSHRGAYNTCWAATADKNELDSGKFYVPVAKRGPTFPYMEDEQIAKRLWDWTQDQLSDYGPIQPATSREI